MVEAATKATRKLVEHIPKSLFLAFAGVGLASLLGKVLTPLMDFYSFRLQRYPDYVRRYGKDSYVLITGASDGIGEALAYRFAKMGFGVVLVGRNEEKLNRVKERFVMELKAKVVTIVEDLATTDIAVFQRIADRVKNLNVSILVNNAGMVAYIPFSLAPQSDVTSVISLNCISHTMLTRILLPQLLARPEKSLIINTASIASLIPVGFIAQYSASKAYMRFFSLALREETKGKIDVFSANPGRVRTKMVVAADQMPAVTELETTVSGILLEAPRQAESLCSLTHAWVYYNQTGLSLEDVVAGWTAGTEIQYKLSNPR